MDVLNMRASLNEGCCRSNAMVSQSAEDHFRSHYANLLRSQNGVPAWHNLSRESVADLCRVEEVLGRQRYDDCCWEPCYSTTPEKYRTPRVEIELGLSAGQIVWPQGKRFAVCLTHDIDHLQSAQFQERCRALAWGAGVTWKDRRRLVLSAMRHAVRRLAGPGHYPLDIWLRAEEQYGFRSTFFFMGAPPAQPHSRDGLYVLDDYASYKKGLHPLKNVLPDLASRGWEIGIHGSIATAFNPDLLRQERERLCEAARTEVISGRQHWLTYDIALTPYVHETAGILVDSSLGSNLLPVCFRAGTGLPFPMFDVAQGNPLKLVQVPMILHDVPLLQSNDREQAVRIGVECLREAASRGSLVTVLFHNDHREGSKAIQVYEEILAAAADLGAWGCTVGDAYRWLNSRQRIWSAAI